MADSVTYTSDGGGIILGGVSDKLFSSRSGTLSTNTFVDLSDKSINIDEWDEDFYLIPSIPVVSDAYGPLLGELTFTGPPTDLPTWALDGLTPYDHMWLWRECNIMLVRL
jgi:hypothetical protein